jgi:hypothetical protein
MSDNEKTVTDAIANSNARIVQLEAQLVGKKGSAKRKLKRKISWHKRNVRKNQRLLNRMDRRDARNERQDRRLDGKDARYEDKMESHQVAYNNGIDPRANMINAIGSAGSQLISSGTDAYMNISNPRPRILTNADGSTNKNMIYLILGVVALMFIRKK